MSYYKLPKEGKFIFVIGGRAYGKSIMRLNEIRKFYEDHCLLPSYPGSCAICEYCGTEQCEMIQDIGYELIRSKYEN